MALAVLVPLLWTADASAQAQGAGAPPQQPASPAPGAPPVTTTAPPAGQTPAPGPAAPAVPGAPVTPGAVGAVTAPPPARRFLAPTGLLFLQVRPERIVDFERFLWYVQDAMNRTTDSVLRLQAFGWHMYKATELGPNSTALYVFEMDPAIANADYGFGPLLASVYTDTIKLQEIWKLYQTAVISGGNLLNLTPVTPLSPTAPAPTLANPGVPTGPLPAAGGAAPATTPPPVK